MERVATPNCFLATTASGVSSNPTYALDQPAHHRLLNQKLLRCQIVLLWQMQAVKMLTLCRFPCTTRFAAGILLAHLPTALCDDLLAMAQIMHLQLLRLSRGHQWLEARQQAVAEIYGNVHSHRHSLRMETAIRTAWVRGIFTSRDCG